MELCGSQVGFSKLKKKILLNEEGEMEVDVIKENLGEKSGKEEENSQEDSAEVLQLGELSKKISIQEKHWKYFQSQL